MKSLRRHLLFALVGLACTACIWPEFVIQSDYNNPRPVKEEELKDDTLGDKPDVFDPKVVDRRPLDGWLVNASAAVTRLYIVAAKPDAEAEFLKLHASYAAAIKAVEGKTEGRTILPSVNLIDNKAKQFDDGLYAALDFAYYQGQLGKLRGHIDLIRRIYDKVDRKSEAAAYLAAGLSLAGVKVEADEAAKNRHLRKFMSNQVASKPISFYAESEELSKCFRFLRFFMQEFKTDNRIPRDLAEVLATDADLRADYDRAVAFYSKLSNPPYCRSLTNMADSVYIIREPDHWRNRFESPTDVTQPIHDGSERIIRPTVAFFPPASTREKVLFDKLFPEGLPASADLMGELIRKIRSGDVKLDPVNDSGWYEYQVHALETLLLPEKGAESAHLLLTRTYKKRMQEAFKCLITRRLETHARVISPLVMMATAPPGHMLPQPKCIEPRLRVEPNPTFYLRTARAYAFLANFLETAVGKEGLEKLCTSARMHEVIDCLGVRAATAPTNLYVDLHQMKDLFYGLYLVSSEDIGQAPAFLPAEPVDADRCYSAAVAYLKDALKDSANYQDTRIVVTIAVDPDRNVTRLWATLGVRLDKLNANYARAPHIKPKEGEGEWKRADDFSLTPAEYLIAVDEFAEIEVPGQRVFTRQEWRTLCDRGQTKAGILAAIKKAAH